MFKYDKKVDLWSKDKIKNLDVIWGNSITKQRNDRKSFLFPFLINYLNGYLEKYGDSFIKRFNDLTGLSFKIDDFKYYINSTNISLHNGTEEYISIGLNHSFIAYPTIIIHEISHLYFYKYIDSENFLKYNKVVKTSDLISEKEQNELKEIITVIINKEFADIIYKFDDGYPHHKDIRKEVLKLWTERKPNFDKWISEVIKIYKKRVAS